MSILIGHASISETGGVNGTKGDSTGKEVCTRTWYSKDWILWRFIRMRQFERNMQKQ